MNPPRLQATGFIVLDAKLNAMPRNKKLLCAGIAMNPPRLLETVGVVLIAKLNFMPSILLNMRRSEQFLFEVCNDFLTVSLSHCLFSHVM